MGGAGRLPLRAPLKAEVSPRPVGAGRGLLRPGSSFLGNPQASHPRLPGQTPSPGLICSSLLLPHLVCSSLASFGPLPRVPTRSPGLLHRPPMPSSHTWASPAPSLTASQQTGLPHACPSLSGLSSLARPPAPSHPLPPTYRPTTGLLGDFPRSPAPAHPWSPRDWCTGKLSPFPKLSAASSTTACTGEGAGPLWVWRAGSTGPQDSGSPECRGGGELGLDPLELRGHHIPRPEGEGSG